MYTPICYHCQSIVWQVVQMQPTWALGSYMYRKDNQSWYSMYLLALFLHPVWNIVEGELHTVFWIVPLKPYGPSCIVYCDWTSHRAPTPGGTHCNRPVHPILILHNLFTTFYFYYDVRCYKRSLRRILL